MLSKELGAKGVEVVDTRSQQRLLAFATFLPPHEEVTSDHARWKGPNIVHRRANRRLCFLETDGRVPLCGRRGWHAMEVWWMDPVNNTASMS